MNYIWSGILLISIVTSIILGKSDEIILSITNGSYTALKTVFSFAGIMCFWCGIMRIAESSNAINLIKKIINPLISHLFKNTSDSAKSHIALNFTANILGLGNAATPEGIAAMEELDKANKNPNIPSYEMCMLLVLNTSTFQLIPTTIMSLRSAAGGIAASVILPIWITSLTALICSVMMVKIFYRR